MARINSNVPSLIAQANLRRANGDLEVRLQRLATGLRINRGADDPAGLITSERLRAEVSGLEQSIANSERASSVISTAEAALVEISDLLNSINALVVEAANTGAFSDEEREANQLQIDSAIDSITRIANSTSFGGLKLLNGNLEYVTSGLATSAISKARIFGVNFARQPDVQVDVEVLDSAQTGNLYMSAPTGAFASNTTLEIAGPLGVQVIDILSGQTLDSVVNAINSFKENTGISAALISASDTTSGMVFSSAGYGSESFVSVKRIGGPTSGGFFNTFKLDDTVALPGVVSFSNAAFVADLTSSNRDIGRDVAAIVNGAVAAGRGLEVRLQNSDSLSLELLLNEDLAIRPGQSTTFNITGGGALYQLGGQISPSQQVNVGIPSAHASRLGGTLINGELAFLSSLKSGGDNALTSGNFQEGSEILASATDEIAVIRGRLGALERNTLQTNIRSNQIAIENLTASESAIRDADFAAETSALSRAQILSQTATSTLALANAQAQQVLSLLG